MRRALIVIGKAPVAGSTKTRLVPPLSAEEAAALYGGFLLDGVHLGLSLHWERVSVVHPRGDGDVLRGLLPSQVHLVEQAGSGIGQALRYAFECHFGEGFDRVVLIGSDNPTLSRRPVEDAYAALDEHDVSIGPTADGGYYLMGLRGPWPGLFEGIDWSTARVWAQTLARAGVLGLTVRAVTPWYDVDTPEDLERLRADLRSSGSSVAPNTRLAMGRLGSPQVAGGTSTVGVRHERSAYAAASRSAADLPLPR
jgi:rSAM/selenodomain-associated transferase 1